MAIKELKTRIALRTGDYAYWTTGAGKDIELYKGEVCVCTVATADNQATNAPTVLFKVANANGQKFADLNWVSGLAADVYAWAKKENPDWTDFPALPLEVIDSETGKFVTDIEYANNKLTIHRANVALDDISDKEKIALSAHVGSVSALNTRADTVVGAINEHDEEIGNLSALKTSSKGDLVSAINETLQAVEVGGTGSVVTVTKQATPTTGSEVTYVVNQGGKAVDVKIEIPKYDTEADYGVLEVKAGTGIEITGTAQAPIVGVKANTYDAHGAAADVKTGVENGTIKAKAAERADDATHADAATKVDNALTIKVGGADVVFDGSAVKTADVDAAIAAGVAEAKKHADDNDANTEYHVEYDSTNKKIKLVAGADASKMEIPTDDFIKDGMIQSVEIKDNKLVITWNTDAGKSATEIPLTELVDIMTGVDGTTVTVNVSADDKISAEVKTGSLKDGHIASDAAIAKSKLAADVQTSLGKADTAIQEGDLGDLAFKDTVATADINDKAVTEAKLEQNVQNALALARTALQTHQDISGKKDKQSVVENLINKEGQGPDILTSLTQDENGEIAYSVTTLHGSDIYLSDAYSNNSMTIRDAIGELADITINGKAIATKDFGTNSTLEARSLDEDIKSVIATENYAKDSELTEAKNKIKALEDAKHISAVEADTGLKVITGSTGAANKVAIDDEIIFVLNANF